MMTMLESLSVGLLTAENLPRCRQILFLHE